jgi:rare lipoprotein A
VTLPRSGGYYLDDGPGANPPADLDGIPDAVPRPEPLRPANARPYVAMGMSYRPMTALEPYKARGLATWYGRRYHGKPTASGEPYDMYAMTGAHTTLPIPSYARVTNLKTGRSVVIRINDRGPFFEGRIVDVSYTAAHKIGILAGATMVEVEAIIPDGGVDNIAARTTSRPPVPQPAAAIPPPPVVEKPMAGAAPAPDERIAAAPPPVVVPAPPVATVLPQTSVTTEGGRVFLQLGAFASRENADGFLARIKSRADWLPAQIISRDGLHRVQAGPYASQAEARDNAERVVQAFGIKPLIQTR